MAKKYFSGFTLVELIIVIAIIAILAALFITFLPGQISKGNDAKRKADINRIKIGVEEYEKDHNCYPLTVVCKPSSAGLQPYLNIIPCDPITGASYFYQPQNSACPSWYRIYSILQNLQDMAVTPGIGPNGAFNYVQSSDNAPVATASPTNYGTNGPTPTPSSVPVSGFYGCQNEVCVPISWDSNRPGPECDPNYQDSYCYGQCERVGNECVSWH
jgi:general secretion pathway protein G